jgi:hypothetical protein
LIKYGCTKESTIVEKADIETLVITDGNRASGTWGSVVVKALLY